MYDNKPSTEQQSQAGDRIGARPGAAARELPRYVRIIESLKRRLASKEWMPGDALPGEGTLAVEYGVSHGTMRKAVDHMVDQNLLVRFQGKGTYVSTHNWERASHFLPMVSEDGSREEPTGRICSIREAVANEMEVRRLEIRAASKVIRMRRVRSISGVPKILERIVLPAAKFPRLLARDREELEGLLYGLYERAFGMVVAEAVERLTARNADGADAKLLSVPIGISLLVIDRTAFDISRRPIEWRVSHCETSSHHYENRVR